VGGSSVFPPTKDFPRGAGRRELSERAWCRDEDYDPSPEPPLLFFRSSMRFACGSGGRMGCSRCSRIRFRLRLAHWGIPGTSTHYGAQKTVAVRSTSRSHLGENQKHLQGGPRKRHDRAYVTGHIDVEFVTHPRSDLIMPSGDSGDIIEWWSVKEFVGRNLRGDEHTSSNRRFLLSSRKLERKRAFE
jgi:hypothetical protein